ncbi:MAG: 6-phosphogluconolactonase [Ferruginibacter sp.]
MQQKAFLLLHYREAAHQNYYFNYWRKRLIKIIFPWKKIIFAFGDERFVAPTSDESNYKMACDTLLNHVAVPKKNILGIQTVKVTPAQSAAFISKGNKKICKR